eukprot:CAMPEP_0118659588 /NCGR_PEP_ID=MMETSP0785-20121206/15195_1 /TAXON_ID=91992 /ORGANISM="Bolidomonas pacifica, Strain CCMP 1866" /LENGTH=561 /DNA_ID=CAMNT_0006552709 /DNA_START=27 /DNA_END=1709 /DNA_ORIENTATION=-
MSESDLQSPTPPSLKRRNSKDLSIKIPQTPNHEVMAVASRTSRTPQSSTPFIVAQEEDDDLENQKDTRNLGLESRDSTETSIDMVELVAKVKDDILQEFQDGDMEMQRIGKWNLPPTTATITTPTTQFPSSPSLRLPPTPAGKEQPEMKSYYFNNEDENNGGFRCLLNACQEVVEGWLMNEQRKVLEAFEEPDISVTWTILDFFLNSVLRLVGQVVFADNSFSGALILAALSIDESSRPTVKFGLASTIISLIVCYLAFGGKDGNTSILPGIRRGLKGFCPFLVGQSIIFFLGQPSNPAGYIFTLLLAPCLTPLVQVVLDSTSKKVFNSGSFTLPFNAVMWLAILQARAGTGFDVTDDGGGEDEEIFNYLHATFRGFAQVFFASSTISGVIISIAILMYSRASFVFGFLGSFLCCSYAEAYQLGTVTERAIGIWGYNGVLTGIALGGVVFAPVNSKCMGVYLLGLLLTCTIQTALGSFFSVPFGTAPFCLASMSVLAAKGGLEKSGFWFVESGERPDLNLIRYRELELGGPNPQDSSVHKDKEADLMSSRSVGRFRQYQRW